MIDDEFVCGDRGQFSGGGAWRIDGAGVNGFSADRTLADAMHFLRAVGRPNVQLGLSVPNLLAAGETPKTVVAQLQQGRMAASGSDEGDLADGGVGVKLGMVFFAAAEVR
jgi:hypothetical protein